VEIGQHRVVRKLKPLDPNRVDPRKSLRRPEGDRWCRQALSANGHGRAGGWLAALGWWCALAGGAVAEEAAGKPPWLAAWLQQPEPEVFESAFPVEADWLRQDCGGTDAARPGKIGAELVLRVVNELPEGAGGGLRAAVAATVQENPGDGDARWLELYARACEVRREQRLATVMAKARRIAFIKRGDIRPSFLAYPECQ